jgi:acetylornithine/N-succinyldiaminopimelate aminotransferase
METRKIVEEADQYLMPTYSRFPVALRKGRGARVWDIHGREYLDFLGGIAVNVLGHCHPRVVVALQKQAQRLLHVSNLYYIEQQVRLAKLLVTNSFADKAFFCNSGAEANEAAIKIARRYSWERYGAGRSEIISAIDSFHGRTMATLTATGQTKFQKGFEPMLPGFKYCAFDDIESLRSAVTSETCAVMLEPIQAEGGVHIPAADYLRHVRELCDEKNLLMILDEVQTGMGRTGKLFAYEHSGIQPDIMSLAKGLGGGAPIGAMVAVDKVAAVFQPKTHASTFGGNPLVCAAAIATIETLLEDGYILDQCNRMSAYLMERLGRLKEDYEGKVIDVRGSGLLIGIELMRDGLPYVNACLERGVLIGLAGNGSVLRLTPPLIIEERDIDHLIDVLEDVLDKVP